MTCRQGFDTFQNRGGIQKPDTMSKTEGSIWRARWVVPSKKRSSQRTLPHYCAAGPLYIVTLAKTLKAIVPCHGAGICSSHHDSDREHAPAAHRLCASALSKNTSVPHKHKFGGRQRNIHGLLRLRSSIALNSYRAPWHLLVYEKQSAPPWQVSSRRKQKGSVYHIFSASSAAACYLCHFQVSILHCVERPRAIRFSIQWRRTSCAPLRPPSFSEPWVTTVTRASWPSQCGSTPQCRTHVRCRCRLPH